MEWFEEYLPEIIEKLKKINPYKIVVFGSIANKESGKNSDIDLLVILDTETISNNYEEKMKNKILVRKCIYDISKKIPIDLLVYTKKEYEIIKENPNSFFKEINVTGKTLYEKAS